MSNISKKEIVFIIVPIVTGILFVTTVFLNHVLFDNQFITARQAAGFELIFFLPGFFTTIVQIPFVILWLFKKQWKILILCVASFIVFWGCIMFGGSQGAAIFYAT